MRLAKYAFMLRLLSESCTQKLLFDLFILGQAESNPHGPCHGEDRFLHSLFAAYVPYVRAIALHHLHDPLGGRRRPQDDWSQKHRKNQKDRKRERNVINQIHILLNLDSIHDAANDKSAKHQHPHAEVHQLAAKWIMNRMLE